MTWQPELASQAIEESMEAKDTPESDRDEVRRFAEFLGRDKKQPVSPEMKQWLLGDDTAREGQ